MQTGAVRKIQIEVTARHFKAPKMLRNFAEKEVRKLNRYYDGIMKYHVILTHETGQEVAEIIAHSKGHQFTAIDSDAKMDRAVVLAAGKMRAQMNRYKEKLAAK